MRETVAHEAPLALAKTQIAKASNHDLNILFGKGVMSAEDLYNLNSGNPIAGGVVTNLKRAWRGRSILSYLLSVQSSMGKMKKIKQLYFNYPESPEELKYWRKTIINLFDDTKRAKEYYTETGKEPVTTADKTVPV